MYSFEFWNFGKKVKMHIKVKNFNVHFDDFECSQFLNSFDDIYFAKLQNARIYFLVFSNGISS